MSYPELVAIYNGIVSNEDIRRLQNSYSAVESVLDKELSGLFLSNYKQDLLDILIMYRVYFEGAKFPLDTTDDSDFEPSDVRLNIAKILVDKTARYMFSEPPDINLQNLSPDKELDYVSANNRLVKAVLKRNNFNTKLVKAAKDCLIGKRVALVTNFTNDAISVDFIPAYEFVYETDPNDVDKLIKFIQFYNVVMNDEKEEQRVYKKKWWLDEDNKCHVEEIIYDGFGREVEIKKEDTATFFDYIPVSIIINDGLSGDPFGDSDIHNVADIEGLYAKLINKDADSLRKGTDQIVCLIDMDPRATGGLSRKPGAMWDLPSDTAKPERQGKVATVDNPMTYSEGLTASLTRLRNIMYTSLAVPDTTSSALQGIVTSGKTMQAIYWDLTVRCNEKMLAWIPAIESCVKTIIEGAIANPGLRLLYEKSPLVEDYQVTVVNNYSILQDDIEERTTDLLEVQSNVRSKKSYIMKWQQLNEEEAEAELEQIAKEMQLLSEDSLMADSYGNIEEASNGNIDKVSLESGKVSLNDNTDIKGVKGGSTTANNVSKTTDS